LNSNLSITKKKKEIFVELIYPLNNKPAVAWAFVILMFMHKEWYWFKNFNYAKLKKNKNLIYKKCRWRPLTDNKLYLFLLGKMCHVGKDACSRGWCWWVCTGSTPVWLRVCLYLFWLFFLPCHCSDPSGNGVLLKKDVNDHIHERKSNRIFCWLIIFPLTINASLWW
jgi:hypothetical protein